MATSKVANKIIVMDLEATCSEDSVFPNETTEIIEIGFCLYDIVKKDITDKTSIIVRPEKTKITPFCTQLTGLTQEIVDGGISLQEASEILIEKWKSNKRIIACYGHDVMYVYDECQKKGIRTPFWREKAFNIHTLFKMKTGQRKRTGLLKALNHYNLEFDGNQHSAVSDAYNTAKLLHELLK